MLNKVFQNLLSHKARHTENSSCKTSSLVGAVIIDAGMGCFKPKSVTAACISVSVADHRNVEGTQWRARNGAETAGLDANGRAR
mmetsp:Transcript_3633/g.4212  ORF Transcript_3633/g.4212 Transcript_3633/m.4212 type:complete len:84 (+) Transcript_3633:103-354(+)